MSPVAPSGQRISARRCIPLDDIETAKFDLLCLTLEDLKAQVVGETLGQPVKAKLVYVTFEHVTGAPEPEGVAA